VIGDPTYADAILDRLVHNAHRIDLAGDSLRRTCPRSAMKDSPAARFPSKNSRQQTALSGRHHVGTASDMISE
jgi:hypothetical protein